MAYSPRHARLPKGHSRSRALLICCLVTWLFVSSSPSVSLFPARSSVAISSRTSSSARRQFSVFALLRIVMSQSPQTPQRRAFSGYPGF